MLGEEREREGEERVCVCVVGVGGECCPSLYISVLSESLLLLSYKCG